MRQLRRSEALFITAVTIAALSVAAAGRGNWIHQVFALSAALWLGVPVAILLLVGILRRLRCAVAVGGALA